MQTRILVLLSIGFGFLGLTACNDSAFDANSSGYALTMAQDDSGDYRLEEYSLAACDEPGTTKVFVCHVPPGNAAAAHTICVSRNGAIHGHGLDLTKPDEVGGHGGDRLGECGKPIPKPSVTPMPTPPVCPTATPLPSPSPSETPVPLEEG